MYSTFSLHFNRTYLEFRLQGWLTEKGLAGQRERREERWFEKVKNRSKMDRSRVRRKSED